MKLPKLKKLLIEEYVPLLIIISHSFIFFGVFFIIPVIIYSYIKWKGCIFLWIAYYLWVYYDSHTLKTEGRKLNWPQSFGIYNCIRPYFPLRLVKSAELTPNCNYLFACFPHALVPQGALWNFCSNVNNVTKMFPGLDFRILGLEVYFKCPIAREFLMAAGFGTVNEPNIKYLLSSQTPKAVVLFPGGYKEASHSYAGDIITVVKNNRKGFVKIALQTGTPLVPVFSFGENNIFDQVRFKSKTLNYLNEKLHYFTRAKLIIPKGRGFAQQTFGILPNRRPINTVVGKPIFVPKVEAPSDSLVNEYHEKFYQALHDLFENNKRIYDEAGSAAKLIMI